MCVTRYQFAAERVNQIAVVEAAFVFGYHGVEKPLKHDVARFFAHFFIVVQVDGFGKFVRLLDGVRADAFMSLRPVPRAAVRIAKSFYYLDEITVRPFLSFRKIGSQNGKFGYRFKLI